MTSLPIAGLVAVTLAFSCCAPSTQPGGGKFGDTVNPIWQADVHSLPTGLVLALITPSSVVVGGNNILFGLDPKTGAQKWQLSIPFGLPYAGVVAVSDSLAALVTGDGFAIFSPLDGSVQRVWSDPSPRRNPSGTFPLLLSDGRVLYASRALDLLALDARTARLDTLVRLPGDSARHPYVASLVLVNDTIYSPVSSDARRGAAFRNTMPYRYSVRARSLDSLRADPSDSSSLSRWMIAQGGLLISSTNYSDPSWLGFDRATGERKWKIGATPGTLGPYSQVAVVGDTLFGGGNDGIAYVIHIPTGKLIRTFPIPTGLVDGVVACGGNVIINVIGQMYSYPRNGQPRTRISGLTEGTDNFLGSFAAGHGIAVIGNGAGVWIALPCPPTS